MYADFSVELGAEDPTLAVPWVSPDGTQRYYDLKRHPEQLEKVTEAQQSVPLHEFLISTNSAASIFATAKCDTWATQQMDAEDEIFGATWKWASYIDLFAASKKLQASFKGHERLAAKIVKLLKRVPEIPAAAEFVVRRAYFQTDKSKAQDHREGFYFTFYLSGYGDDEEEAHKRWMIGLKLVENALLQLSASEAAS